jgi:tRNA1(Val) A37 N6-methylase TrmN6
MDLKPVELPFGKTIYQTKYGQSVSSDVAFLLTEILEKEDNRPIKVLELGSGNGILSLMLAHYRNEFEITGIEIQPQLVELAKKNLEIIGKSALFLEADLNEFFSPDKFAIICCNPPFQKLGEGKISPHQEKVISRTESKTNMQAVFHSISRNLDENGNAYLIYPQSRLSEAFLYIEKNGLILIDQKTMSNHNKNVVFLQCQKRLKK